MNGTINYTPISFDAIHSVCAEYGVQSTIIFAGITTTFDVVDEFALGCVTAAQFHLFTNWNRYSGRIDVSYAIRRSNTAATIYMGVHTVCLTL